MPILNEYVRPTCLAALVLFAATAESWGDPVRSTKTEAELIAVLESKASASDKAITCKHLAVCGTSAAVPALAPLLADPQLSSWARIALEVVPGPAADEALRQALATAKGRQLIGVINSIGVREDPQAVDELAGLLKHRDDDIAVAAALNLGRIGNAGSVPVLTEALQDPRPKVRNAAAESCVRCAEHLAGDGKNQQAVELYDSVQQADVPLQRTLEATRGAILADQTRGLERLLDALRSTNDKVFQTGTSTARELNGEGVAEALVALLPQLPADRQALLLQVFASRGDKEALPQAMKLVLAEDRRLRLEALRAVGQLGDSNSVAELVDIALNCPDDDVSNAAKEALKQLPGPAVDQTIQRLAAESKGQKLVLLLDLIGTRTIAAQPLVLKAVKSSDAKVRKSAWVALGKTVGPQEFSVFFTELAELQHAADSQTVIENLQAAAMRMPNPNAVVQQLEKAMQHAPPQAKTALLRTIAAVEGKEALRVVGKAMDSDHERVRGAASELLGKWRSLDAAPVLLELANGDYDSKYRIRALRGYIRIARQFDLPAAARFEMCERALEAAGRDQERNLVLDVLGNHASMDMLRLVKRSDHTEFFKQVVPAMAAALIDHRRADKQDVVGLLEEMQIEASRIPNKR